MSAKVKPKGSLALWCPRSDAMPRMVVVEDWFHHPEQGRMCFVSLVLDGWRMAVVPEGEIQVLAVPDLKVKFMEREEEAWLLKSNG